MSSRQFGMMSSSQFAVNTRHDYHERDQSTRAKIDSFDDSIILSV